MALLRHHQSHYQIRPTNKEPEWSSICDNVFDQYLAEDDLFGLESGQRERSSSDDSINLFDFSGSSEQSNFTDHTSPIPSWSDVPVHRLQARQPQAKEGAGFWTNTLKALERNAADSETRQQRLRASKSHPDFLSLGGHPSPPVLQSSPPGQSSSTIRCSRTRMPANGRVPTSANRSVSRGRPSGITKTVHPSATVRKISASPHKMMNPSRYRAGFKDVWADKLEASPNKYELRVPSHPFPASPPPSAKFPQDDGFAAFGSPLGLMPLPAYDADLSPLATTFQQAHIYTPVASPLMGADGHNSYFESLPLPPANPYAPQTVPLNDVSPIFPERTDSLAPNRIQPFDFGFSDWPGDDDVNFETLGETLPSNYSTHQNAPDSLFVGFDEDINAAAMSNNRVISSGLGISCDPSLMTNYSALADMTPLPPTPYQHQLAPTPSYTLGPSMGGRIPMTPTRRRQQPGLQSRSPSPPKTEPRSRRTSASRQPSRHRRTKSSTGTPRSPAKANKTGFINFTPHDSSKILGGVAPSGSSKTKARREKEAADKRRRLSQAAVKAVVEAGGDLDSLAEAGLI